MERVSSARVLVSAIQLVVRLFVPVVVTGGLWLVALHGLEFAAGQGFGYATDYLHRTGREDIAFIAFVALAELCFTLIWSAAWIVAIAELADASNSERVANPSRSLAINFNQVLVELVRSLGSVLWRTPLLIVPALVRYVRLAFIPLVVLFDGDYRQGRADALAVSSRLSRGHFWLLTFVLAISFAVPWYAESLAQGDRGQWVWENPGGALLGWIVTLIINTVSTLFLFGVFRGIFPGAPRQQTPPESEPVLG
jgi:hypothetical protein